MIAAGIHLLKDLGIWQAIQLGISITFIWTLYTTFVDKS